MLLSKSLNQVGDFFFSNFVAFSQFFNFNLLKSMLSFLAAFFLFGKYWQFGQKFCGLKSMRCFRCTCIYFIQKGCKQFSFVRASHINAFNHENHRRALIQGRWSQGEGGEFVPPPLIFFRYINIPIKEGRLCPFITVYTPNFSDLPTVLITRPPLSISMLSYKK